MDDLKNIVNGIGAYGEVVAIFYGSLRRMGINSDEAIALTTAFIASSTDAMYNDGAKDKE